MTTRMVTAFPTQLLRWFMAPALFGALFATAISLLRSRTRPSMPRMSDEWLRSLDRSTSGESDSWR